MSNLANREIKPPRGNGAVALQGEELSAFHELLGGGWLLVDEHHLEKEYRFNHFQAALDFTVCVGELAEWVDHHPEICLSWGRVKVTIWTHSVGGLSEADFVFAARADQLAG
ncbi:MAG: 4a-hydroxytetrahydrobiopterin dehydratase [Anaerolineales bacterium]|nr:4a-hydroxytetrahydrobiopterin dehydratase [Anaerolineales bacterium]